MMDHMVYVDIITDKGIEEEVEVYFELDDYYELTETDEKIKFIKKHTKNQYDNVKKVLFTEDELNELEKEIDDMNDTFDMYPNETEEEFFDHEAYD